MPRIALALLVVAPAAAGQALPSRSGYAPLVKEDDGEAERARRSIAVAPGLRVDLFAAEPHCANLVALDVDPWGRCFLVETFRRDKQVLDIRNHLDWLEEDLACRTVDDRRAMIARRAGAKAQEFRAQHERVRLVRDRDRDGRADLSTVFADGFNDPADGVAAGVLFHRDGVLFAGLPSLWRLRDRDGDGVAEGREVVSTGYGVHFNYVGHDLHGLRLGPDGRLWFSMGDRGLDVATKEGGRLSLPDTGAVLRCELDGSGLELVHTGLRNPQDLAFNDAGDLFTGDNNSDGGDRARLVHVVEGGDSGWSVGWQWIEGATPRGFWNSERMWHPRHEGQPAFLVPCVANLARGPSGLAHEPGTAFAGRWRDRFFLCDFTGDAGSSQVVAFSVRPDGAGYRLDSTEPLIERGILPTDCDFGPDGALYVSDWVHGWQQPGRGRVWRISDPERRDRAIVAQTRDLLRHDLAKSAPLALMQWLGHPDQRVRFEAQFGLAQRGEVDSLRTMARHAGRPLARVHAVWGLGQIARRGEGRAVEALLPLLADRDAELRAQAARVLGDARAPAAFDGLAALLADREARPRFFAAIALGRLGDPRAVEPLVAMLERDGGADALLRHAGVMGLSGAARDEQFAAVAGAESAAVRTAALLAMRRRGQPELARFLVDRERTLVLEAARAIHDLPLPAALEELARMVDRRDAVEPPLLLRALNANLRLGGRGHAERLARAAARADLPEAIRGEALRALAEFDSPPARDRLLGVFRPCAPGRAPAAAGALRPRLEALLAKEGDALREEAARCVAKLRVEGLEGELEALVRDAERASGARVAALEALSALCDPGQRATLQGALSSDDAKLRGAARRLLARLDPALALPILEQAIERGSVAEQQEALAALGETGGAPADGALARRLDRLLAGQVAGEIALDLLEAAERRRSDPAVAERLARFEAARRADDPLARWRECELGGDPRRGRALFFERNELQCTKCHKVGGEGAGESGPDLAGVGLRATPEALVESIALPNRTIAVGYGTTVFVLRSGDLVDGRLIGETPTHWHAVTSDRGTVQIRKSGVASLRQGLSAMPSDLVQHLSRRDLRDLVAWLATLK